MRLTDSKNAQLIQLAGADHPNGSSLPGGLDALGKRIHERAGIGGTVIINQPAEVRLLQSLRREELDVFAADRGLNVVSRMGATVFEFGRRGSSG